MQPCPHCQARREGPAYPYFSPTCLWCGARLIKCIGQLPITREAVATRRRKVLEDWMKYGHAEADLRRLAKQADEPLQPLGQAEAGAFEPQTKTKPRSVGRKP